jgi:glycerophosphoryl diester phosphodiesterase
MQISLLDTDEWAHSGDTREPHGVRQGVSVSFSESASSTSNRRVLQALRQRLGLTAPGELNQVATKRLQQAAVDELIADRPECARRASTAWHTAAY